MEQILEHLPAKRALDLILTGREFGADEALQIGLVARVVGPDDLDGTMGGTRRNAALARPPRARVQALSALDWQNTARSPLGLRARGTDTICHRRH